jgi:hypothetical protein
VVRVNIYAVEDAFWETGAKAAAPAMREAMITDFMMDMLFWGCEVCKSRQIVSVSWVYEMERQDLSPPCHGVAGSRGWISFNMKSNRLLHHSIG